MARAPEQEWASRREIPDPQVKDVADQYEAARRVLSRQPPHSGVLWPLMNTAAVAIELHLKCLSAEKIHLRIEGESGGSMVYAQAQRSKALGGHSLSELWNMVPPAIRRQVEEEYCGEGSFIEQLQALQGSFTRTRYPFEWDADASEVKLPALMSTSKFLSSFVNGLTPHETILWAK